MTVTPKNGWENTAPARGYECGAATIKIPLVQAHESSSGFCRSAPNGRGNFASNVPRRSHEKLIGDWRFSLNCN